MVEVVRSGGPGYSFKIEPIGFYNWSDYERHQATGVWWRQIKDDSKAFGLRNWKAGTGMSRYRQGCGMRMFLGGDEKLSQAR